MWVHHSPTYHRDCPYNVNNQKSGVSVDDGASENRDVIYYSEDSASHAESISLKESMPTSTGDSSWCFEKDRTGMICLCGPLGHKKECPLN